MIVELHWQFFFEKIWIGNICISVSVLCITWYRRYFKETSYRLVGRTSYSKQFVFIFAKVRGIRAESPSPPNTVNRSMLSILNIVGMGFSESFLPARCSCWIHLQPKVSWVFRSLSKHKLMGKHCSKNFHYLNLGILLKENVKQKTHTHTHRGTDIYIYILLTYTHP